MNFINVYYPTWQGEINLFEMPDYINYVTLSFLRTNPEIVDLESPMNKLFYDGNLKISELQQEIKKCRQSGSSRTILGSVGGEIAGNFEDINWEAIVAGIDILDLDGVDIDFEPNGVMTESDEEIERYINLIKDLRLSLDKLGVKNNKKYIITCAPTGIGLLKKEHFNNYIEEYRSVRENLKTIVSSEEWAEELSFGSISDSNILKQEKLKVGTAASCFNFDSAGKMFDVFLSKNTGSAKYNFIGQMVDIVFYQAYNMGSGNILGKILCYESHRNLSEFFNHNKKNSGFKIGHGSHVGKEAWPHFSYTKKRIGYIYSYISKFGRESDGASYWSYLSSFSDDSENVPEYGMGFTSREEVFKYTNDVFRGINEN